MHLTEDTLERLTRGQLSQQERNETIRHLLSRCPECLQLVRAFVDRFATDYSADYGPIFESLSEDVTRGREELLHERLLAAVQWASLQRQPSAHRSAIISDDPTMHTWGMYERLLQEAKAIGPDHPQSGIEIAQLAILVADMLDPTKYGETRVADFKAAALAMLGNYKRVAEDFEGARVDLEHALAMLETGTGDPLERARILSLQGSWHVDLGFFEQAERLFTRAIRIYEKIGDDHMVGRTLLKQATAVGYVDPERAVSILDEASDHINSIAEPLLELCMRHSLALYLNDAGRTKEAVGVLEDSRSLYKQFSDRTIQLRLHWLEGKIARNLRHLREAEKAFEKVATGFLDKGLAQEHLLCSIDLAEVVHVQGDRGRTLQICTSLYQVLEAWHMHTEGLSVMLLFVKALREDNLKGDAFLSLIRYMQKAWHLPQGVEDLVH